MPAEREPHSEGPTHKVNHPHDWTGARYCRSCGDMELLDSEAEAPNEDITTQLEAAEEKAILWLLANDKELSKRYETEYAGTYRDFVLQEFRLTNHNSPTR